MNARTIKTIALLVLLWLAFAANATAAPVFYVPQWSVTFGQGGIQLPRDLSFRGLVALDASTLAELRRWTDIPPVRHALVSADERYLFLWNDNAYVNPGNFYVYDRASMRPLRTWIDFRATSATVGFYPAFDGYSAVAHPSRPNIVIFRGVWWFDTDTGQWIETPQTIALPSNMSETSLFSPRLSSNGRWLTVYHHNTFGPPVHVTLAIDLDNPRNLRVFDSAPPGGVVALDGNTLVHRRNNGSLMYTMTDLDTGATRAQFPLPRLGLEMHATADGAVYFSTRAQATSGGYQNQLYRLLPGQSTPELFTDQSALPGLRGWLQFHARGAVLLTTRFQSEDCSLLCLVGDHELFAFAADGSLTGRSFSVSDQFGATWYSSAGNALSLQGLPDATGVSVLDKRIAQALLVLAVFALAAFRGVRAR